MAANKLTAVIDPGHEPGHANKGSAGYYEYQGMWKLSNYLMAALKRCGWDAYLTRQENENPSLSERGRRAKGADLFISEHSNGFNGTARGVEVYHSVAIPGDKQLAAAMSKRISGLMGNPDRGAKTKVSTTQAGKDYYTVMYSAETNAVPHVLLAESGFHDNPNDEAFLLKDENLKAIAEAQADVICNFFGVTYQQEGTNSNTAVSVAATVASTVPDWQMSALETLKKHGMIQTPNYWLPRMGQPITTGETMALLVAALGL